MSEVPSSARDTVPQEKRQAQARIVLSAVRVGTKPKQIAAVMGVTERHIINIQDALRLVGEL